jgi:predicted RNA-binding protein YlxR (DUF448 family)
VACRSEEDREDLVRLVWSPDGELVVDLKGSLPGRGAWVHPAPACLERVEREPSLLGRALREPGPTAGLAAAARAAVLRALADGLSQAAGGGGLVFGHDALDAALRGGEVVGVLTASDASERTVGSLPAGSVAKWAVPFDRAAFGERVGLGLVAVAGIRDVPCTVHLRRQLRRWTRLG